MTTIERRKIGWETVEVPEGYLVCPICDGKGGQSKYDQGWRSMIRNLELSAIVECWNCRGLGYVKRDGIKEST